MYASACVSPGRGVRYGVTSGYAHGLTSGYAQEQFVIALLQSYVDDRA